MSQEQSHIVIVGGGLAGLAAAVSLSKAGLRVTILESRPRAGGRASSFLDKPTGEEIDNCQHVALGCCTNYLNFLEQINSSQCLERIAEYQFIDQKAKAYRLVSDHLPAPFHLLRSFLGLRYLSWGDRFAIGQGLFNLARLKIKPSEDRSFAEWLIEQRQPENTKRLFWEVVLVSALSEELHRISLVHARKVFVDTFLRNRRGMEVIIPQLPLSVLYGEQVDKLLTSQGSEIRLQTKVDEIVYCAETNSITKVRLQQQQEITGTHYVCAVPWFNLEHITSEALRHKIHFQPEQWSAAPISSVHFWFDRAVIPVKQAVLLGRLSQWVFERHGEELTKDTFYYQVVISQSRELAKFSQQEIISRVKEELAAIWPEINVANLLRSRVVTEHKAVFSPLPGIDQQRPAQKTSIPNFYLAGDWTQTGWPATMEGAVRSGYRAAEHILKDVGQPQDLIIDDLPCSWWSTMLFGIPAS